MSEPQEAPQDYALGWGAKVDSDYFPCAERGSVLQGSLRRKEKKDEVHGVEQLLEALPGPLKGRLWIDGLKPS